MKKNIFIIITLLLFVLPALAQVSGGAIKRPSKSQSASKVTTKSQKKPSTIQYQNRGTSKTSRGPIENLQTKSPVTQAPNLFQQKKALTGYTNGHAWVDLGLPSGTLWATMNIGASKAEEYGDYFAWGETKGYNSGKTNFYWSTYKWCKGSDKTITKYCDNSGNGYNGFTDNKEELVLEDDAAYVLWGSDWRLPSKEQCEELINSSNTTTEWTTLNGVNGRKITSKANGYSVFLPAAGGRCGPSLLYFAGLYGYYWSRTLDSGDSYNAWGLYFNSSNQCVDYYGLDRCHGRSVRPVCSTER